jgi:eukaryotic-like serine/threonine-protein kinase
MLTGRRAFDGDTRSDVVAAVINGTPDWNVLPPDTPPLVRRLLHRCLEKDPKRRLRHIGDARSDLEEALSSSTATTDAFSVPVPSADARIRNRRRGAALVAAAFAVGGVAGTLMLWRRPAPLPVVRTIIAADTFLAGTDRNFAFTPDGRAMGYISSDARQMFVRPLHALEPTPILTTATYIKGIFPSPDGRWFAYVENNFDLKKVPATGGPPSTLLTMDGPSRGAAWGSDGTIVFATGSSETGLQRVAAHGGPVTVLTRPDRQGGEADHVNPVWLPGGRSLLFTILPAKGGLNAAKVAVLDLPSGTWRAVLEGGFGARYVDGGSGGYLVYAAAGALWAQGFDVERLEAQGTPRQVLRPVSLGAMGGMAEFDIGSDGALAYSRGAISQWRRLPVWVDRSGREIPLPVPHDNYTHPRFSPDATRLAIVASGDIFVWDWRRPWSTATRLIFEPRIDWYPVWTPDSRRILFGSWRAGGFSNLYSYDLETASTERLTDSPDMQLPTSITPDGTTLIFHRFARSIQAIRLEAGAVPMTLVDGPADERNGELSPDGRWLAYEGESPSRPGELDVYVRLFSDINRGVWQVSKGGGLYPVWSRDGRELFYVTLDGTMVSVPVEASGTTWRAGSPTPLFRQRYDIREGSLGRMFDVAPDGRFLMMKNESNVDAAHIVLVQNWVAELAREDR